MVAAGEVGKRASAMPCTRSLLLVLATLTAAAGCGGSSSSSNPPGGPAPTPTAATETFSGTTVRTATGGCTGDVHGFTAAEGEISVRLTATSDSNNALSVQVCGGPNDAVTNCAVRQQKITVGQMLSGARQGPANQTLKFLGHNCVFGGPAVAEPITYTAVVTYLK
jgi:hypothetical protein